MKPNIKLTLFVSLVMVLCGAAPYVRAEVLTIGVPVVKHSSTAVCENEGLNAQVRAALRVVCAHRGAEAPIASAGGLIVIGFLGGFAKTGDCNHPEVWFGAYLRERYPTAAEVSVISNHQRQRAMTDVLRLLDTNQDGALTAAE